MLFFFLIDFVIVGILVVYFVFIRPNQSMTNIPNKAVESADQQMPPVADVKPVQDRNNFFLPWTNNAGQHNIAAYASNFPERSWYKVEKSTGDEFEVILFPNVGKQEFARPYDFRLHITIKKTDRPAGPIGCSLPKGKEDLTGEDLRNANYDITVRHRLDYDYSHSTVPYGNPNPYTPETTKILLDIWKSLRIGNCKP